MNRQPKSKALDFESARIKCFKKIASEKGENVSDLQQDPNIEAYKLSDNGINIYIFQARKASGTEISVSLNPTYSVDPQIVYREESDGTGKSISYSTSTKRSRRQWILSQIKNNRPFISGTPRVNPVGSLEEVVREEIAPLLKMGQDNARAYHELGKLLDSYDSLTRDHSDELISFMSSQAETPQLNMRNLGAQVAGINSVPDLDEADKYLKFALNALDKYRTNEV